MTRVDGRSICDKQNDDSHEDCDCEDPEKCETDCPCPDHWWNPAQEADPEINKDENEE